MALTYGSSTTSARPESGAREAPGPPSSSAAIRARNAASSGGGEVSSGVKKSPKRRACRPRLTRLVRTLNGMLRTIPAITGVNHQNVGWSRRQMALPQIKPAAVWAQ